MGPKWQLLADTVEKLPDAASDETLMRQVGSPSTKDSGWSHRGFDCCVTDSRSDFINGIGTKQTKLAAVTSWSGFDDRARIVMRSEGRG